jgi:cytochrome c-type biogenesis protein CcmH
MGFWIATGAFSALVALVLIAAYVRPRAAGTSAAEYDLRVYRDQLRELDRDVERGVISGEEAARAKVEVSRRVLEADRALQAAGDAVVGVPRAKLVMGAAIGLTVAGAFGVYLQIGAPGYTDLPLATRISMVEQARADRPAQTEAEAEVTVRSAPPPDPEREALVIQLRTIMEQRTDDAQGLALLAGNEAALGNFRAARLAQGRLVEVLGDAATGRNHIDLAEMMVLAAGGYVSPEAEAALERGLALTPQDGTARYYAGLMFAQQGRPDLAFPIWRSLLADSSPDAPWLDPIRLQIEEVAYLAGVNVTLADLPQPRGGPTSDQIAAAEGMSAEDRQTMVAGMVEGLAARLADQGGPPEDWARLIGAYVVLGETDAARAAYAQAKAVYAEAPDAMAVIDAAAAGLERGE